MRAVCREVMSSTSFWVTTSASHLHPAMESRLHWSRIPLTWCTRCRSEMGVPKSGTSGTWVRMSSSHEARPSFTSSSTAMAVKCLETEATWKTDRGVMGIPYSRLAIP